MSVWSDVQGQGPPVTLLHEGVADSRMWKPQLPALTRSHTVLRVDLPGFGRSPLESDTVDFRAAVCEALDAAGIKRTAVLGGSLGGRIALELAVESPERVSALALLAPGIDDHEWSTEVQAYGAEEEAALERGDLEGAVEANLRLWLAGPRRDLDAIDPEIRELAAEMQRDAFSVQKGHEDLRLAGLDPPASQRLGDIRVPTLVITGDEDVPDMHQIADRLVRDIPGAQRATIPDGAHLANLEHPEEFNRIVLGFLSEHGG